MNTEKHKELNEIERDLKLLNCGFIDTNLFSETVQNFLIKYRLEEYKSITLDIKRTIESIKQELEHKYAEM